MIEITLRLSPNGRGATAYLPRDLIEDSACPLFQGGECRAIVYPGVGVLLARESDTVDYSIEP